MDTFKLSGTKQEKIISTGPGAAKPNHKKKI
jgi:hypothetical protein